MSESQQDESVWYDDGLRFACTQCGDCCTGPPGFVWFDDVEAQAMADHLKLTVAEFRHRFARFQMGQWTLEENKREGQYDCVFLRRDTEGKALCSVYPVRPKQCRTWPFWPENMRSKRDWDQAAQDCPGMKQGQTFYPVEQVRIILQSNPDSL